MLEILDLSFGFGQRKLFKELTLRILPGQILRVEGRNGVGKSTLLNLVAGLISVQTGEIRCFDLHGAEIDDRRNYCEFLSAESNHLFGKLTAYENLKFWVSLKKDSRHPSLDIRHPLNKWGLGDVWVSDHLPVEKFSTGMKRRLALSRLTASPSPLWVLDEPLFGLDKIGVELLHCSVQEHLLNGGSCMMVSHEDFDWERFPSVVHWKMGS